MTMLRLKLLLYYITLYAVALLEDTEDTTYINYYKHYISQLIYQKEALMLYDFLLIQKLEKLL